MIQEGKEKALKSVPNGWKGKPPTSYTQEKVDVWPLTQGYAQSLEPTHSASNSRLYLHSDLISESEKEIAGVGKVNTPKVDFGSFHQPFRFTSEGKYTNAPLIEKISPPM
jgi:hypothetical protein